MSNDNTYHKLPYGTRIDNLSKFYEGGIKIIGDIHGQYNAYEDVLNEAILEKSYPIQMGDLLDRGPDSYKCLVTSLLMKESKVGNFVSGNHEYKHYRYMMNPNLGIRDHHIRTIRDLENLSDDELFLFLEFMQEKHYVIKWKNFRFAHASYHPIFEKDENLTSNEMKLIYQYALYGPHMKNILENPKERFSWIKDIPEGIVSVVGHTRFPQVTEVVNENGGRVIFTDIGCEILNPPKAGYLNIDSDGNIDYKNIVTMNYNKFYLDLKEFKGYSFNG